MISMFLRSTLGLFCNKTYGAMTNYDDGDEDGNKHRNDNKNVASGSGSNVLIFDQITMPLSCGG